MISPKLSRMQDMSAAGRLPPPSILPGTLKNRSLWKGLPGSGKQSLQRQLPNCLDIPLIRLQCYEGLDESKALYEWKYGKQLELYTQILKDKLNDLLEGIDGLAASVAKVHQYDDIFFSRDFLAPRPLPWRLFNRRKVRYSSWMKLTNRTRSSRLFC